jgi:hypothetical protein
MQVRGIITTQTSIVKNSCINILSGHLTTSLKCYLNAVTVFKNFSFEEYNLLRYDAA